MTTAPPISGYQHVLDCPIRAFKVREGLLECMLRGEVLISPNGDRNLFCQVFRQKEGNKIQTVYRDQKTNMLMTSNYLIIQHPHEPKSQLLVEESADYFDGNADECAHYKKLLGGNGQWHLE